MSEVYKKVPGAPETLAAANQAAGDALHAAISVDHAANIAAAHAALGPIGAEFMAAFTPAYGNLVKSTSDLRDVHYGIADGSTTHSRVMDAHDEEA